MRPRFAPIWRGGGLVLSILPNTDEADTLPVPYNFSAVYAIWKDGECVYVGQSSKLGSRLFTHLSDKYADADFVSFNRIKSRDRMEANAIAYYNPRDNIKRHDNFCTGNPVDFRNYRNAAELFDELTAWRKDRGLSF